MRDQNSKSKLDKSVKATIDEIVSELAKLRVERGYSLRDVSYRSGLAISTLSNYENFVHSPDVYRLALWAQVLGMEFKVTITAGKVSWTH